MTITKKGHKNITEVGEILIRLATLEDATERALLASKGVKCLLDVLADSRGLNLDDIDIPDFMKKEA